jgi:hypothetical protein
MSIEPETNVQSSDPQRKPGENETDFARSASAPQTGFLGEFWMFLREYRKWWLTPMIVVLLLLGALVVLGGTAVAPFIYTLF